MRSATCAVNAPYDVVEILANSADLRRRRHLRPVQHGRRRQPLVALRLRARVRPSLRRTGRRVLHVRRRLRPPADRVEPWEPNVTALLDPAALKWKDLVTPGTPLPTPWHKERVRSSMQRDIQKTPPRDPRGATGRKSEMDALFPMRRTRHEAADRSGPTSTRQGRRVRRRALRGARLLPPADRLHHVHPHRLLLSGLSARDRACHSAIFWQVILKELPRAGTNLPLSFGPHAISLNKASYFRSVLIPEHSQSLVRVQGRGLYSALLCRSRTPYDSDSAGSKWIPLRVKFIKTAREYLFKKSRFNSCRRFLMREEASYPRARRQETWPSTHVQVNQSSNAATRKVRIALGDSAEKPKYFETLGSRGYRFIAPLQILSWAEDVEELQREGRLRVAVLPFQNLLGPGGIFVDAIAKELSVRLASLSQRLKVVPIALCNPSAAAQKPSATSARNLRSNT